MLCCLSCKQKEEKKVIIVPPPVEQPKKGTQQMSEIPPKSDTIKWLGNKYIIIVSRSVDKNLPKVADENGIVYYDNSISVLIKREDDSEFFNRTFRKSDFQQSIGGTDIAKRGALLGIVYDKITDNKLTFAASIGSPDVTSDEFFPLIMTINRMGEISVVPDTRMDTDTEPSSAGGITGDEEA